jgi:predicted amidohydrolase
MKIALAQIAPELGAVDRNLDRHLEVAARAADRGADVVVFPELSLTGYDLREQTAELALEPGAPELAALAAASAQIDLAVGFVARGADYRVFNAAGYFAGGARRVTYRKVYLPTYGAFEEGRWFAAGDTVRAVSLHAEESQLAKASGAASLRCGLLVCEDLWHPSVPYLLAQDGAQVLLALVNGADKGEGAADGTAAALVRWEMLARTAALAYGVVVAVANRTGSEGALRFFGSSFVVGPDGNVLARAAPYEDDLLVCEVDRASVRRARAAMPLLRDERLELTARELARVLASRTADGES